MCCAYNKNSVCKSIPDRSWYGIDIDIDIDMDVA